MMATPYDPAQSLPGSENKRAMGTIPGSSGRNSPIMDPNVYPAQQQQQQHEGHFPPLAPPPPGATITPLPAATARLQLVFDGLTVVQKKKTVISNACGLIKSGELTAVVSCCGARGDYYLLNALSGHLDSTGTVMANGTPVSSERYLRTSALIDDERTSLGELTVKQNIQFSAEMRSADYTTNLRRVNAVLEALGLDDVANKELRKCTAFVRRCVCVAKELVLSPEFVYVDSAIEGLPTHEAKRLLEMLRQLAVEQQIVVVTSLVQPRYTFLEMVDNVLLLEGTHVVYTGPVRDVITPSLVGGTAMVPEAALNNLYRTATSPDASLQAMFHNHPNTLRAMQEGGEVIGQAARGEILLEMTTKNRREDPFSLAKFAFMLKYSLLAVKNNVTSYIAFAIAPLFVAILLAAIYTSQSGQIGMQNRIGIIFFLISGTFLHNMLFVDVKRRDFVSFQRLRAQGYYGPGTYLTFLVVTSATIRFFCSIVFSVIIYSLSNIESYWNLNSLKDLVGIVALTSFSSHILVWFVCCLVPTTRIAHFLLFAVYAFNTIMAGIILNVNTLPRPFQVMSFGSLIRLGYESALVTQFTNQTFGCGPGSDEHDGGFINGTWVNQTSYNESESGSSLSDTSLSGAAAAVAGQGLALAERAMELAGAALSAASGSSSTSSDNGFLGNETSSGSSSSGNFSNASMSSYSIHNGAEPDTPVPSRVVWANGGHVSTHSCYTGDEYMAFLGFKNSRRWTNLEIMAIFAVLGIIGSYLVMTLRKPTSKW